MRALALTALLVYTFGAFAYGAILVLWVTHVRHRRWGSRVTHRAPRPARSIPSTARSSPLSLLWFCCNVGLVLFRFVPRPSPWQLDVTSLCLAFVFPPIIMHSGGRRSCRGGDGCPAPGAPRSAVAYTIALVVSVWAVMLLLPPGGRHHRFGGQLLGLGPDGHLRDRRPLQHRPHRQARRDARAAGPAGAAVDARALRVTVLIFLALS